MSRYSVDNNRTALITLSTFALLAISLTFGLALLQSNVQAVGGARLLPAHAADSKDRYAIEEKLRLIEIEFNNYQKLIGENSPVGSEIKSQAKSLMTQLLVQLHNTKRRVENASMSMDDALALIVQINLLDEKIRRQEPVLFSNAIAKQSKPANSNQAPQPRGVLTPAATGAISGTITDATTSAPLQGVGVRIYNSDRFPVTSAFTDSSGVYTTPAVLATGTYYALTFNSSGYLNELYNNIDCSLLDCNITSGTPISVTDGMTTSGINFALATGGRITGTVIDASTSAPLANVFVFISSSTGQGVSTGFTDSSGSFISDAGLPTGTYYANTFNQQGYIEEVYDNIVCLSCSALMGTPISVTVGSTTSGINFALDVGGRISGTIIDEVTSAPLPDTFVLISNSSSVSVAFGFTDASGNYICTSGLPTGTYFARTSSSSGYINELYDNFPCDPNCAQTLGTPITVTIGSTTSGINFALEEGGIISGRVTDAATSLPLANVFVLIMNKDGAIFGAVGTDSSGNHSSLVGLPAGTYFAFTSNSQGYIDELYDNIFCGACDPRTGTPISVTAGSITSNIDFALDKGGVITGNITDAVTFAPLANVTVFMFNSDGLFITSAITNGSGEYSSGTGLPTDSYYALTLNSLGYVNQIYKDIECVTCSVTSGTPIPVTEGLITSGIKFGLRRGGQISGTVTNAATSLPMQFVAVTIWNSSGNFMTIASTDSSGNYITQDALSEGTYYAFTFNNEGLVNILYDGITCISCVPTTGTGITVLSGQITSSINFALCPFSLSAPGQLFGASGGEGSFAVTSPGGCGWEVFSNVEWIEITSSQIGSGNATVSYLVRDNLESVPRTGTIFLANQTFIVTQEGQSPPPDCAFSINPQSATYNATGGTASISVTTQAGCAWQSGSDSSWITITSNCCGVGSSSVSYTVQPNQTGTARTGKITIAGKKFNVKQTAN